MERVSYFDATGRAEAIRLTLAIGGNTTFEDDRFAGSAWPELKPTTRWGMTPEATVAGRTYGQSHAILRYAGKTAGLYPSDALAALAVDEMLGVLEDMFVQTGREYFIVRRAAGGAGRGAARLPSARRPRRAHRARAGRDWRRCRGLTTGARPFIRPAIPPHDPTPSPHPQPTMLSPTNQSQSSPPTNTHTSASTSPSR